MSPMSPRTLRPRQTGFNPKSISGLAMWLDASAPGSLFQDTSAATASTGNPNPVGYWKDLSGNGNHATQGTANNRPIISPDLRNGRNVLRFDGLSGSDADFLQLTATAVQTVFAVCFVNTAAGNLSSIIGNSSGSPDIRRDSNTTPSSRWRGLGAETNLDDFTNPSGSQFRVNGVSTSSVAEQTWHMLTAIRGTGTAQINQIARSLFSARSFGGDIAEFVCYDRALTDSERDRVERALGKKWGLTIG
jgi:hypothetical protein